MRTTHLLSETEEARLAAAVEIGVLAEDALRRAEHPPCRRAELDALVREGVEARHRLLLANVGLATVIARGELRRSPIELAELVQEGLLALSEALVRYDYRRGRFGPYAASWIRARVRAAVTTQCGQLGVPVKQLSRYYGARRSETDLVQELGRLATDSDAPRGKGHAAVRAMLTPAPFAAAMLLPDESATRHLDLVDEADVVTLLARLPAVQQRVVRRRFGFDGPSATLTQLATELGVSETTVRRVEAKALAALRAGLARLNAA